ncbi:Hsp20/alpha crystallin family protein [Flavisolibacter nicotianae]|uniref:Hsp20/alpha crystallin family protein n=1 Tax=Flavisolibacter nicotianae TaxID=2364882 RepID=UPI000EAE6467
MPKPNRKGENEKYYSPREYSNSSFTRSFQLPENAQAESINTKFGDGVLKITIPETEQKLKSCQADQH